MLLLSFFLLVIHTMNGLSMARVVVQDQTKKDQTNEKADDDCKLPETRDEIAKRVAEDQKARFKLLGSNQPKSEGEKKDGKQESRAELFKRLSKIDKANTAWLKQQVETHGWLGKSLVGVKGAHDAWLLVQHADLDRKFQRTCLDLMTAMPKGEVGPTDIAYLTDRVLLAEGKPQRYGTQCKLTNGKAEVQDVEDREKLNERRSSVGLEPIEKYLKQVEKMYAGQSDRQ